MFFSNKDPSPSIKYQQEIGRYLLKNLDDAIVFLNSLLGQLNWAFSEFMGLLKDVSLFVLFLFGIFYCDLVGSNKSSLYANS
jgi:hypothetical protein